MPGIRMVSHWEGSEHERFLTNARKIKAIWLRHGATDFRIARIHTGQQTGQYEVSISFDGWRTFGSGSETVSADAEFVSMMAAAHANGRMTSRSLIVEESLD